jgi:hypothetical protein
MKEYLYSAYMNTDRMIFLVKVKNSYYVYSTVWDIFTEDIAFDDLNSKLLDLYPGITLEECEQILRDLDTKGTTCPISHTAQQSVECNCMGRNGERLSWEEILREYG